MPILRRIFMLSIIIVFSFSSISLGADPQDPYDPRWIESGPWIDPRSTYFRTCNDNPLDAVILDLYNYNISIGDWVVIRGKGGFLRTSSATEYKMYSVFSTSTTLLDDEVTRQHRVPYAVPVPNYSTYSLPTWFQCIEQEGEDPKLLETNIPEDFKIASEARNVGALVEVPARYLFVSAADERWFSDNIDPDMDYHVEFSDEVKWVGDSGTCTTCWDDTHNWDVYALPAIDVGVTFDSDGTIEVTNADSVIKYLLILGGEVKFVAPSLDTVVDDENKPSFIVAGGEMSLVGGELKTDKVLIGYKDTGKLSISGGGVLHSRSEITIGKDDFGWGRLSVSGQNSSLEAEDDINLGDEGNASINIWDRGQVYSQASIFIGGQNTWSQTYVEIKSGGGLGASGPILILENGYVELDGGNIGGTNIYVHNTGTLVGCNSGTVTCPVFNVNGNVGPGCSTGKLIIDGDYVQEAEGTLEIEVGGYNKGEEYDVLEVTGNMTLNGTLKVNFINGFAPKKGDVFEFTNVTGSVTQNLSKVETSCVADNFQNKIELVEGKLTMTALNDARAIPCGGPKAMPWIPLLLLED